MILEVEDITCTYDDIDALSDVTVRVASGDVVGILGPNGAGKSTLIRAMSRVLRPRLGRALLDGRDLYRLSASETARSVAVVPQEAPPPFEFTCHEIVMMGRAPHLGRFQSESAHDYDVVRRAMERTETWDVRDRPITQVSGGERQRVVVARALAQEPRVLLLDEPTAHLDLRHQVQTMRLVTGLGCAVVAVMHDLNLAAMFCRTVVLLDRGHVVAAGITEEVFTSENLSRVYGVRMDIVKQAGRLVLCPTL